MITPISLDFPLAKAEYLLTRVAEPGKGGDKRNYWQNTSSCKIFVDYI